MILQKLFPKSGLRTMKDHSGFTLVEMMLTVLIFTLMVAGIFAILAVGEDSWKANRTEIELIQELRKAHDGIINDLRRTSSGKIDDVPVDSTTYNMVTFTRADSIVSSHVTWEADPVNFVRSGDQLIRTSGAGGGTTKVLAQHILDLDFQRSTEDILEVTITAERVDFEGRDKQLQMEFDVQLRN